MVSYLFYYQLVLLALVWLFLMVHVTWSTRGVTSPPASAQPEPLPPKRTRAHEPKPFEGLTHKPHCALCERDAAHPQAPLPVPPDPMSSTHRRPREVDTSQHFCPPAGCDYRGWLGLGNLRANGHPSGGPWRQFYCTACKGYFLETHGTIFHGKQASVELIVRVVACLAEGLGIRATARVFEVDANTVLQWLVEAAEHLRAFYAYFLCNIHLEQLQLDELYAVLRDLKAGVLSDEEAIQRLKRSPYWVWTAMDPQSKLLVMEGLRDRRTQARDPQDPVYPEAIAGYIVYLKQLYPPIHLREIARILLRKFGYQTNHHTLKRFLAPYDTPIQLELDLTTFASYTDAYQARWRVVRRASEGWNKKSIADCLKLSRTHVYGILDAFERDGFEGLEDQRRRPLDHPANQLSLPFFKAVLDLQHAYPRAGRFRLHGLLAQQSQDPPPSERTVGRAMALNRQFHGAPGPWTSARDEQPGHLSHRHLPYRPDSPHQMWCTDIRYLVPLEGRWVYSICIIDGYSRKILAGMVSPHQDLTAVLQILYAALAKYGCPQALVSDNGSVLTAGDYLAVLRALEIEALHIEHGKPWQNLIEAQFKVQLRLADYQFEQAQILGEVQNHHAAFIATFNTTAHWAHRQRDDGYRTPVDVLGWLRGRRVEPQQLAGGGEAAGSGAACSQAAQ